LPYSDCSQKSSCRDEIDRKLQPHLLHGGKFYIDYSARESIESNTNGSTGTVCANKSVHNSHFYSIKDVLKLYFGNPFRKHPLGYQAVVWLVLDIFNGWIPGNPSVVNLSVIFGENTITGNQRIPANHTWTLTMLCQTMAVPHFILCLYRISG